MLTLLPRRLDDPASTEPGRPPEIERAVRKTVSRRPIQDNARTQHAGEKEPSEQSNGGRRRSLTRDLGSRNPGGPEDNRSYFNAKTRTLVRDKSSKKIPRQESSRSDFYEILGGHQAGHERGRCCHLRRGRGGSSSPSMHSRVPGWRARAIRTTFSRISGS